MTIRYVQGKRRAVDSETGKYIESEFLHYQSEEWNYWIHSAVGTKILVATVKQEAIDLSGDGKRGLYRIDVLRIRQPTSGNDWSDITDEHSPIAQKVVLFIEAFLLDHPGKQATVEFTFDLAADGPSL